MRKEIEDLISRTLSDLGTEEVSFVVEHPADEKNGDYSTNVAMIAARALKSNPMDLAGKIAKAIRQSHEGKLARIEVAGGGFINFFLSSEVLEEKINEVIRRKENFGKNNLLKGQKVIVEYTDPNPFKEFHIGHLMSNAIGESISRLIEWSGAEIKRTCYQGDVGLHVAYAVAHKIKSTSLWLTAKDLGNSYSLGAKLYKTDENFKLFVEKVNKSIYLKDDTKINEIYEQGKKISLEYFESIYKKLGTKFDNYLFESTTSELGKTIVKKNTPGVFEESEGAVVYRGEKRDKTLHTRVFMTKEGLPTYEAKELGLAKIKYDIFEYDKSLIVTGSEIKDYFKVLLSAMEEIYPDLSSKTLHIPHGMLRLPQGKMSSRTGDVISAENLLKEVSSRAKEKMTTSKKEIQDLEKLVEEVAIGAIKYSILKQTIGKDIIFDINKSISFEGDSGPYLQYTFARIQSLIQRAKDELIEFNHKFIFVPEGESLTRKIYKFPELVEMAAREYAPQRVIGYLIDLAGEFNNFYAKNKIVDTENKKNSVSRLALASAVAITIQNGLFLLAIKAPQKM